MYLGYFFNLSSSYVGFHKLVRKLAKLAEYLSLVTGRPFRRHCCRAGRWGLLGTRPRLVASPRCLGLMDWTFPS